MKTNWNLRLHSSVSLTTLCIFLIIFSNYFLVLVNASYAEAATSDSKIVDDNTGFAAPRINISETVFDFGEVYAGEKIVKEFQIHNDGNRNLLIKGINAACGCTATLINSKEVKPSESATLQVTFDTSGFQGHNVKTVRINTNDPLRPSVVITVQGIIKKDIELEPQRIYFGKVRKGEAKQVEALVRARQGTNAKILELSTKSDGLSIEELSSSSSEKRFVVKLSDKLPVGIFREWVIVKTTSPKSPVINIPVFARIEGDLTILPADVSFGLREGPLVEDIFETVELINYGDKPVSILKIGTDDKSISATIEENPKRKGFIIRVGLKKGTTGTFKGSVEIVTDHEDVDQQIIKLPVYGIVSEKS